jgi:hypothetical protein
MPNAKRCTQASLTRFFAKVPPANPQKAADVGGAPPAQTTALKATFAEAVPSAHGTSTSGRGHDLSTTQPRRNAKRRVTGGESAGGLLASAAVCDNSTASQAHSARTAAHKRQRTAATDAKPGADKENATTPFSTAARCMHPPHAAHPPPASPIQSPTRPPGGGHPASSRPAATDPDRPDEPAPSAAGTAAVSEPAGGGGGGVMQAPGSRQEATSCSQHESESAAGSRTSPRGPEEPPAAAEGADGMDLDGAADGDAAAADGGGAAAAAAAGAGDGDGGSSAGEGDSEEEEEEEVDGSVYEREVRAPCCHLPASPLLLHSSTPAVPRDPASMGGTQLHAQTSSARVQMPRRG